MRLAAGTLEKAGYRVTCTGLTPAEILGTELTSVQRMARRVRWFSIWAHHRLSGRRRVQVRRSAYDINVFFERVIPEWLPTARFNCLIPNQEWFHPSVRPFLGMLDLILCKTKHAEAIFSRMGCRTEFISFTSEDRLNSACPRDPQGVFHLAGSSQLKGTQTIFDLWLKHPEWPLLTVVQHPKFAQPVVAPNVRHIIEYADDAALRRYQNGAGIHVCPSEAEGFGHSIVEAMSCGVLVITTDAPPMNELVTRERGLLASYRASRPQSLGIRYSVDPGSLAEQVELALNMAGSDRQQITAHARAWYEQNDGFFTRRFVEVLTSLDR